MQEKAIHEVNDIALADDNVLNVNAFLDSDGDIVRMQTPTGGENVGDLQIANAIINQNDQTMDPTPGYMWTPSGDANEGEGVLVQEGSQPILDTAQAPKSNAARRLTEPEDLEIGLYDSLNKEGGRATEKREDLEGGRETAKKRVPDKKEGPQLTISEDNLDDVELRSADSTRLYFSDSNQSIPSIPDPEILIQRHDSLDL